MEGVTMNTCISDDDYDTTINLALDNGNDSEDHPRRFVPLWNNSDILVYGGSKGLIRTLHINDSPASTKIDSDVRNGAFIRLDDDCLPRWWDDDEDIRAVGISKTLNTKGENINESRIALGLDSGCTVFLLYENIDASKVHPFTCPNKIDVDDIKPKVINGPSFGAPVRDIQFHPQSSDWVIIATEEGVCMLHYPLSNSTDSLNVSYTKYFQEEANKVHDGSGIRCVCFSPNGNIVASLGMDGRLCLWYVSLETSSEEEKPHRHWKLIHRDTTRCITKRDTGEILGSDAWDRSCRPYFISDTLLVIPGETYLQFRHIQTTINPDTNKPSWTIMEQIEETKGHVESIVTFTSIDDERNSDHKHLIATGRDKRITLWSINLKIKSKENPKVKVEFLRQISEVDSAPTDLLWWPAEQEQRLMIARANGKMVALQGSSMIPIANTNTKEPIKTTSIEKKTTKEDTEENADTYFDDSDDENVFGDSSDVELNNSKDFAVSKKSNPFIDDEADDDDVNTNSPKLSPRTKNTSADDKAEKSTFQDTEDYDDNISYDADDGYSPSYSKGRIDHRRLLQADIVEKQPPFAPSSSPLDLPRRYLCWNSVGSVTIRQSDSEDRSNLRNTVDIHFTDSGVRRPISFTDNLGFILGSLGEDGGIFATDLMEDEDDDDDDILDQVGVAGLSEMTRQAVKKSRRKQKDNNKPTGSSIYFHRFETFAALREKDWYLTLPNGERVLGCATGEGWAAVMTSRRFLRLFSSGGNQGQIFWLDGQPITIVGRGRFLAVFYHQGEPFQDGTQNIGCKLVDAVTNRVLSSGTTTCISNGATLTWSGFSNDGSLLVMDSEGMVSMLVMSNNNVSLGSTESRGEWVWMPVLDTLGLRKSSDDSYWPVTVYDGKLVCVPLKGKTKYPDATRRPVTAALSLKLPLARNSLTAVNVLEELSIRASIALSQKKVLHEITSDADDDDFQRSYHALSAQVDKVTLKMFAAIVEAGKLERALDLVERLYLEKSFDIAMTIADNHRKLVDFIEGVKDSRFPPDEGDDDAFETPSTDFNSDSIHRRRISPDNGSILKRSMQDSHSRLVRPKQSFT